MQKNKNEIKKEIYLNILYRFFEVRNRKEDVDLKSISPSMHGIRIHGKDVAIIKKVGRLKENLEPVYSLQIDLLILMDLERIFNRPFKRCESKHSDIQQYKWLYEFFTVISGKLVLRSE